MRTTLFHLVLVGFFWANLAVSQESLSITRSATAITIRWEGGGALETADRVTGPWVRLDAAATPYQFQAAANQVYFRVWHGFPLTVKKGGAGSGSVTSQPLGIDCGETCGLLLARGSQVTLKATPNAGSVFAGWSGDGSGTDTRQLVMDSAKSVTATFETVAPAVTGLVNGDFEAGPDVGWEQDPYPLIYSADQLEISISGRYAARLGYDRDNRHSAILGQKITLPAAWTVTLNMALYLYSEETCEVGIWDTFGLYINGQALEENARLCHTDTFDGWHRVSFDLSAYAGQTIMLEFAMWTGGLQDPLASVAFLDELSIVTW
jgi:hypothetical protein